MAFSEIIADVRIGALLRQRKSDELRSIMWKATCYCGDLRLECSGNPSKVSLCHCFDCQRRTGSLFSVAAFFPREVVVLAAGVSQSFHRPSASGFEVTFHHCSNCGSNVWWEPDRMPHLIGVAVGAFADPNFPMPEQAVWAQQMHRWLELPASLPSHAKNPAPKLSD